MLKRLVQFSLDQSALVLLTAGVALVLAGWRLPRIAASVCPELDAATAVMMAASPGPADAPGLPGPPGPLTSSMVSSAMRNETVLSAPWFWLASRTPRPSRQPAVEKS